MEISKQMNIINTSRLVSSTCYSSKLGLRQFEAAAISCRQGQGQGMQSQRQRGGKTNFYKVLSLDNGNNNNNAVISIGEIKKAYRSLALKLHPDVCPDPSATNRFLELQLAYETLSDPVSRQLHDYELGLVHNRMEVEEMRRKSKFPRHVWEKQLFGLKKRSHVRIQRMKNI